MEIPSSLQNILIAFGVFSLVVAAVAIGILWWLYARLRRLRIAKDARLIETLRGVPLLLVVALDMLDMSLNLFSAPFVFGFLHHMGWTKLRNLATAVAVVPGTQVLPVLTTAWLLVRLLDNRARRRRATPEVPGGTPDDSSSAGE